MARVPPRPPGAGIATVGPTARGQARRPASRSGSGRCSSWTANGGAAERSSGGGPRWNRRALPSDIFLRAQSCSLPSRRRRRRRRHVLVVVFRLVSVVFRDTVTRDPRGDLPPAHVTISHSCTPARARLLLLR